MLMPLNFSSKHNNFLCHPCCIIFQMVCSRRNFRYVYFAAANFPSRFSTSLDAILHHVFFPYRICLFQKSQGTQVRMNPPIVVGVHLNMRTSRPARNQKQGSSFARLFSPKLDAINRYEFTRRMS